MLPEDHLSDAQAVQETGHDLAYWNHVLVEFHAQEKPSVDAVAFLQQVHAVPRDWARTLAARFLKQKLGSWKA